MDASKNTPVKSRRPRRWAGLPAVLLFAVVLLSLTATGAAVAATPAPSTVSEVAASAGQVVAQVAAPGPGVATPPPSEPAPPPSSAPTPSPAASPAPDPAPASVAKPVTDVVDRSLDSVSRVAQVVREPVQVVREPVHRVTETADAVIKDSGVTQIPAVEETARRVAAAAGSLGDSAAADGTKANAAPSATPAVHTETIASIDTPTSRDGEAEPAPGRGWAGPPSALPRPGTDARAWSIPRGEIRLTAPGTPPGLSFLNADARRALDASASMLPGDDAARTTAPAPRTAPPPAPAAATVSSPSGGTGFTSFVLLLGLLAVFALAVPRAPARPMAAACRYRSALFVCALERPG